VNIDSSFWRTNTTITRSPHDKISEQCVQYSIKKSDIAPKMKNGFVVHAPESETQGCGKPLNTERLERENPRKKAKSVSCSSSIALFTHVDDSVSFSEDAKIWK
jgi:hypothetical protein